MKRRRRPPHAANTQKAGRGRWYGGTAGGCEDVETLNVPKCLRTGTGAIHQEIFMISRFSAPQTPGL